MKKIILILVVAAILPFMESCKKDNIEHRTGTIQFFSGEVFIVQNNQKVQAKLSDHVTEGMKIVTGAKSFADIQISKTVLKISERTMFSIAHLTHNTNLDTQKSEFFLEKGKVLSSITKKLKKGDSYRVMSSTSVAAVRGTEFFLEKVGNVDLVGCTDGRIAVRHAGGDDSDFVILNKGEMARVEPGKKIQTISLSSKNLRMEHKQVMKADIAIKPGVIKDKPQVDVPKIK